MPITWRNINAPNFSGTNQAMSNALKGITIGGETLTNAVNNFEQTQQDNFTNERNINTQRFLDTINQQNNLDGLSGLDSQYRQAGFFEGQNVDTSKIFGALDTRENTIQQDIRDDDAFRLLQQDIANRPHIEAVNQFGRTGDVAGYKEYLKANNLLNNTAVQQAGQGAFSGYFTNRLNGAETIDDLTSTINAFNNNPTLFNADTSNLYGQVHKQLKDKRFNRDANTLVTDSLRSALNESQTENPDGFGNPLVNAMFNLTSSDKYKAVDATKQRQMRDMLTQEIAEASNLTVTQTEDLLKQATQFETQIAGLDQTAKEQLRKMKDSVAEDAARYSESTPKVTVAEKLTELGGYGDNPYKGDIRDSVAEVEKIFAGFTDIDLTKHSSNRSNLARTLNIEPKELEKYASLVNSSDARVQRMIQIAKTEALRNQVVNGEAWFSFKDGEINKESYAKSLLLELNKIQNILDVDKQVSDFTLWHSNARRQITNQQTEQASALKTSQIFINALNRVGG